MGTPVNPNNNDLNANLGNITPPLNTSGTNNTTNPVAIPVINSNDNTSSSAPVIASTVVGNQAGMTDLNSLDSNINTQNIAPTPPPQPIEVNNLGMHPVQASVGVSENNNSIPNVTPVVSNSVAKPSLEIGTQSIGAVDNKNEDISVGTPNVANDGSYEAVPVQNTGANNIPIETLPTQSTVQSNVQNLQPIQPSVSAPIQSPIQSHVQPVVDNSQINITPPQPANNQVVSQVNSQNNTVNVNESISVSPISITPPSPVSQPNVPVSSTINSETIVNSSVQQNVINQQNSQDTTNAPEVINYNNVDTGLNAVVHDKQEENTSQKQNNTTTGVTLSELVQQSKMQSGISHAMGVPSEVILNQSQSQEPVNNVVSNPNPTNVAVQPVIESEAQSTQVSPLNATENELIASMKSNDDVVADVGNVSVPPISIDPITSVTPMVPMPTTSPISPMVNEMPIQAQNPPTIIPNQNQNSLNNQFSQNTLPPLAVGVQPQATKKQGKSTVVMIFFIIVFLAFGVVLLLAGLELSNSFNLPDIPFLSEFIRGIINK